MQQQCFITTLKLSIGRKAIELREINFLRIRYNIDFDSNV